MYSKEASLPQMPIVVDPPARPLADAHLGEVRSDEAREDGRKVSESGWGNLPADRRPSEYRRGASGDADAHLTCAAASTSGAQVKTTYANSPVDGTLGMSFKDVSIGVASYAHNNGPRHSASPAASFTPHLRPFATPDSQGRPMELAIDAHYGEARLVSEDAFDDDPLYGKIVTGSLFFGAAVLAAFTGLYIASSLLKGLLALAATLMMACAAVCRMLNFMSPPAERQMHIVLVCAGTLLLGVAMDMASAGKTGLWVLLITGLSVLVLSLDAPAPVCLGALVVSLLYGVLRSIDDVHDFGFMEVMGESRSNGDATGNPGLTVEGVELIVVRVFAVLLCSAASWRYRSLHAWREGKLLRALFCLEDIINSTGFLDFEAVKEYAASPPSPINARAAATLAGRIATFARYLPDSLAVSMSSRPGRFEKQEEDEMSTPDQVTPASRPAFSMPVVPPIDILSSEPPAIRASRVASSLGSSAVPSRSESKRRSTFSLVFSEKSRTAGDLPPIAPGNPLTKGGKVSITDTDSDTSAIRESESPGATTSPLVAPSVNFKGMPELGVRTTKCTILAASLHIGAMLTSTTFPECKEFVSRVMDAIRLERGTVLELRGDTVLGAFNGFISCVRHCKSACVAGLRVSDWWRVSDTSHAHWCSCVVSSGEASAGSIGDERRCASFVTGTPLREVHRLESLTRTLRVRVLCTEMVHDQTNTWMRFRPVDLLQCWSTANNKRGTETTEVVYELLGYKGDGLAPVCDYTDAFTHLQLGHASEAAAQFTELEAQHPDDFQVRRLAELARTELERADPCEPVPYLSVFPEWISRSTIRGTVVPGGEESRRRSSCPPEHLAPMLRARLGNSSSETRLREMISSTSGLELSKSSACASSDMPLTFTDFAGSHWRRSYDVLARGGNADVYTVLGEDGALCAMKNVEMSSKINGQRADDLLKEVGMLSTLQHRNIVAYLSCAVTGRHLLIIMEYVGGGSLNSVIQKFGLLPSSSCRHYMKDILRGLAFLHAKGIVHRDLKPANVLLDPDGCCKLADFGASVAIITKPDTQAVGTPPYIAPEAATGHVNPSSDLWSLGVTLCELLTGKFPFPFNPEVPMANFMYLHFIGNNSPTPVIPNILTPHEDTLVKSCLKRDPAERPAAKKLLVSPYFTATQADVNQAAKDKDPKQVEEPEPPESQSDTDELPRPKKKRSQT